MTDKKICPICFSENSNQLDSCHNCGFSFIDAKTENTDWLDNLRSDDQEKDIRDEILSSDDRLSSPENLSTPNQEEIPDWFSRIEDKKETEKNILPLDENKNFSAEKSSPFFPDAMSEDKDTFESDEEIPEWLNQMRHGSSTSEEKNSSDSGTDLPDWLSGKETGEPNKPESPIPSEETLPDWLSNLSSGDDQDEETTSQPIWASDDTTIPERNDPPPSPNPLFGNLPNNDLQDDDLPDWLQTGSKNLLNTESETSETSKEPDWLKELSNLQQQDSPTDKEPLLSNQVNDDPQESGDLSESHGTPFASDDSDFAEMSFEGQVKEENQFTIDGDQDQETFSTPFFENEVEPEEPQAPFINKDSSLPPPPTNNQTSQPFTLDDMPDWLEDIDKVKSDELEETPLDQNKFSEEKVQLGNLPSWLKAMRPVSAVAPNEIRKEDRKKIEKTGPLAGLQGVLSSESAINHYTAPPTYTSKINISEKNKLHAQLLEEIFTQDKLQKAKTQTKSNWEFTIVRLIIPTILIITLLISFFNLPNSENISSSRRNMPAVQFASIANSLSTTLNAAPHVLVVMDSDAASIGELQMVSQRAFETFMIQNSWLAVMATNPTGLIVSNEIIQTSKQNVTSYNDVERIINLGYLPGNEIGIQGFISNPQLLVQLTKDGRSIWTTPGLMNIKTIRDFDSIWIISDNAESTQKWIEQLHASNFDKPILISATTQATPILSTYLIAGQYDGLIGGLQGASTYEQLTTNSPTSFIQTWQLYQSAIFIFLLIILGGAVFQIFENVISSKNK